MNSNSPAIKSNKNLILVFITIVGIIIAIIVIGLFLLKPGPEIIQGQAEANETRISGKLTGRIAHFYVEEGKKWVFKDD